MNDFDLLRQAVEARAATLPVPSGETAWTASRETLEVFRRSNANSHRLFAVGLGKSRATGVVPVLDQPCLMQTAIAVEAWWRLTPHGQDDTRDTGWYAAQQLVAHLRAGAYDAHLLLVDMDVVLVADSEWCRIVTTWTALHMVRL